MCIRDRICLAPALPPESYTLDVTENQLTLCAADDLGAVYGLLDISCLLYTSLPCRPER